MESMSTMTNYQNFTMNFADTEFNTTLNETFKEDFNKTTTTTVLNTVAESEGRPTWRKILDIIQILLLSWGIVTNLTSAICFRRQPSGFSRQILLLFEHQAWIDFTSCVTGFMTVVLPAYWSVGIFAFDFFMCYLWHGQILYWVIAANSFYGLVLIAMDRYLAVVKPIYYKTITVKKVCIAIAIIYSLSFVIVWPLAFLVKMEGDKCVAGFLVEGNAGVVIVKVHAVLLTIYEYVVPCMWFLGLYGKVIYTLKKKKESSLESSSTMEKASSQIMKAAFAVTGLFMFTIGWAFNYYMWGVLEIGWKFEMNSPIQQIDVLMASINSSANPLCYFILMPKFRNAVKKTLPCSRKVTPHESTRQTDTTGTT